MSSGSDNPPTKKKTFPITVEAAIGVGVALAWSRQYGMALVAAAIYFGLRHLRPSTAKEILFVCSVIASRTCHIWFGWFYSIIPVAMVVESSIVFAVGAGFFLKQARVWAYALVFHSAYVVFVQLSQLNQIGFVDPGSRVVVGGLAVQLLIVWMLVVFIRLPDKPIEKAAP